MNCWKYVDDLTLAENRPYSCSGQPQVILDQFCQWTDDNKLRLNPSKCQALQVCYKREAPTPAVLKINEFPLQYVNQAKILGVWIQNDLKWNKNILETSIKINRKLYMLRVLKKFGFTLPELVTVYKGYIRPLLEYADVVWHSSFTCQQSHQLEQLQRRACRIIMGCEFISYSDALQKCDLVTLSCRRRNYCQLFAERLSKSTCICTADLLPPTRQDTHSRNLRNSHHISQLRIKTSRYKNSPIPFFIDLLNEHSQP